ncbi:MAG: ABC transporter permease [Prevotella sp.]|nr:ABC transporter permease [Prevotella sp.]
MNQKKRKEYITNSEKKEALKEISKFVLDLAKLVFAGVILGSIMDMEINKSGLLIIGGLIAVILIASGAYAYYVAIKKY